MDWILGDIYRTSHNRHYQLLVRDNSMLMFRDNHQTIWYFDNYGKSLENYDTYIDKHLSKSKYPEFYI
jgi:hypothetical protein